MGGKKKNREATLNKIIQKEKNWNRMPRMGRRKERNKKDK